MLACLQVFVLWPANGIWYEATLKSVSMRCEAGQLSAQLSLFKACTHDLLRSNFGVNRS